MVIIKDNQTPLLLEMDLSKSSLGINGLNFIRCTLRPFFMIVNFSNTCICICFIVDIRYMQSSINENMYTDITKRTEHGLIKFHFRFCSSEHMQFTHT